jgi:hypothetical protein
MASIEKHTTPAKSVRRAADDPDPEYSRVTMEGLQAQEAEDQAEEERRRASTPPPPTPEQNAEHMRAFAGPAFLHGAFRSVNGPVYDVPTFKAYLDDFLKRAGATNDPLEEMLLRQLLQADLAVGRLHVAASASHEPDAASAYVAAAARLMAEFRKTTAALEKYREAAARKQAAAAAPPAPKGRKRRPAAAVANGVPHGKQHAYPDTELGSNDAPVNRLNEYFRECEVVHS